MNTIYILSSVIFLLVACLHEVGHILFMKAYGLKFKEFGFGMKVPGFEHYSLKVSIGSLIVSFNPLPLGLFVATDIDGISKLKRKQQVLTCAGGSILNLVTGFAAYFVSRQIEFGFVWWTLDIFAVFSFLFAVANLLPISLFGFSTDGSLIFHILRGEKDIMKEQNV